MSSYEGTLCMIIPCTKPLHTDQRKKRLNQISHIHWSVCTLLRMLVCMKGINVAEHKHSRLEEFISLAWYEAFLRFITHFIAKSSEILSISAIRTPNLLPIICISNPLNKVMCLLISKFSYRLTLINKNEEII
jgi:hypothetical protein